MEIKVVALSQEVSFEDGSITNILLMKLPSGRPLRAVVTDASAKMLFEDLASHATGAPHVTESVHENPPAPSPPHTAETRPSHEDGAVEFGGGGGDSDDDEPASPAWFPGEPSSTTETAPSPDAPRVWTDPDAQARAYREKASKDKKNVGKSNRGLTVQKNDRGYPVVSNKDGVDVNSVISGGVGADEEGVGQI